MNTGRMQMLAKIERWVSLLMAAGLGYFLLLRVESGPIIAWALIGLGALAKCIIFAQEQRQKQRPLHS